MKKLLIVIAIASAIVSCSKEKTEAPASVSTLKASCVQTNITSGNYYYNLNPWNGGTYCIWLNNINSWGCNANQNGSSICGYPSMVHGCHWGNCSANWTPQQENATGSVKTWFSQSSTGSAWDAAYDIWYDYSAYPGNRAATYELMIWLNYTGTQPIASSYTSAGVAVPYASNVSIAGNTYNIYQRGNTFSFLLTNKQGWVSTMLKPISDYCVSKGWFGNTAYLTSVQAGWEIIKGGTYTTYSYGVAGI